MQHTQKIILSLGESFEASAALSSFSRRTQKVTNITRLPTMVKAYLHG